MKVHKFCLENDPVSDGGAIERKLVQLLVRTDTRIYLVQLLLREVEGIVDSESVYMCFVIILFSKGVT